MFAFFKREERGDRQSRRLRVINHFINALVKWQQFLILVPRILGNIARLTESRNQQIVCRDRDFAKTNLHIFVIFRREFRASQLALMNSEQRERVLQL